MSKIIEPILCYNGLRLSVQASKDHFCTPQDDEGPYSHVEVCTYDVLIPTWENPVCLYDRVTGKPEHVTYYNVEAKVLKGLIDFSSGIKKGKLPKLVL